MLTPRISGSLRAAPPGDAPPLPDIPLFSGDISVNSISIDDPIIKVQKNKDGSLNLSNLLKNSNTESDDAKGSIENKNEQTASLPNISFNLVRIKNGVVHYKDASSNDEKVIRNINMEVSASNLTGPFSSDGSLFYDGYGIDFELQTDKYNADEKNISPKSPHREIGSILTTFFGTNFQVLKFLDSDLIKKTNLLFPIAPAFFFPM